MGLVVYRVQCQIPGGPVAVCHIKHFDSHERVQLRWPSCLLPVWQCHSDTGGLLREFQMLSLSFDILSPMPHGNWAVMKDPFLKADLNRAAYFLACLSAAEPCTSIHY